MDRRPSRLPRILLALAIVALLLLIGRDSFLRILGRALVHNDGPAKADIAVVLAGDYWGNRIQQAAELARRGYVPAVLVDGPPGFYGTHESDFAIPFIVHKGYPAEWFINFPIKATSTREEAWEVLPELRRRNVHTYLLVTSEFHSARAARTFASVQRALHFNAAMRVVTCPDQEYATETWWHTRQGQKAAFFEWCKTFASAVGL